MSRSPVAPHGATPAELRARLDAERRCTPFLVFRDGDGAQRIVELSGRERFTLGRSSDCDIALTWDPEASRLHAELERVGSQWLVVDDGLSSNGTFLGGERVIGRRRLRDGDHLLLGGTSIAFRHPGEGTAVTTWRSGQHDVAVHVTAAQRRVLVALCRPFKGQAAPTMPATNTQIAAELCLSVAARAFSAGLVSDRDL